MTSVPNPPAYQTPPGLSRRAGELRADLQLIPAEQLAIRSGSRFVELGLGRGEFHLSLFNSAVMGSYPGLTFFNAAGDEFPEFRQLLLLYYFFTADGAPLTGNWVSFADLPGGRMYNQAFQGYSGNELVKTFGLELGAFKTACFAAGGRLIEIGSVSFAFSALPCVPLLLTYWPGDEDFPSSCKVLFDSSATHYLPIDGCAILGSQLVQRVIKNSPLKNGN